MPLATLSNTGVENAHDGMVVASQADVDAAFRDMEHLLAAQRPVHVEHHGTCVGCGGGNLVYNGPGSGNPGSCICDDCGIVQPGDIFWETMYGRNFSTRSSNYKRVHHWHERISQLLLMESPIPPAQMLQIAEMLCDGTHQIINKDTVRSVLRSLNLQLYIEKWLQIIFRITQIQPPCPGPLVVQQLDALFQELQRPFDACKTPARKNFLNYNYVFCRLFQKMGCTQFGMFFPLIKSKPKLKSLDDMWTSMTDSLNWPITPLIQVAPFAVRLEQPSLLLQRLGSQCALPIPVAIEITPLKMVYQRWDRHRAKDQTRSPKRPHSYPPAPEFQRLGLLRRRLG